MDLGLALAEQERAWRDRPLVRQQYGEWYRLIVESLAHIGRPTVELGSGIGKLRQYKADVVTTDIEPTPWADLVVDAEALPYDDGEIGNLVLLDVFHHLADPARFLDEARRVLAPGGRVVIIDPYCSPVSGPIYKRFHHERTDLDAPPFERDERRAAAPLESNQARATLVFYRNREQYLARWPELPLIACRRFALVLYPLTGGFTRPPLLPRALYRPLQLVERALQPLAPLLAFRCLIVLERR